MTTWPIPIITYQETTSTPGGGRFWRKARGIGSGDAAPTDVLAAAIPKSAAGNLLTIHVEVWDEDDWFADGDDRIGEDTFTFDASSQFGADRIVHVENHSNYRLTLSPAPDGVCGRLL